MQAKVVSFFEHDTINRSRIEIMGILIPDMDNLLIFFKEKIGSRINISGNFTIPNDLEIVAEIEISKTFVDKVVIIVKLYNSIEEETKSLWHSNAPIPF